MDLCHDCRVGEDREGLLEALQIVVADQDCGRLAVGCEHDTVVLVFLRTNRSAIRRKPQLIAPELNIERVDQYAAIP